MIRHTIVEVWTGRYHDAWDILEKAKEFFDSCGDALKGRWHGQRGLVLRKLATAEKRPDYADRAIMEFTAAIHHYEQAGHERYCANNFNNLAMLLYQLGRYAEAHENLDRAEEIFERRKDTGNIAQVNETRARVLVAEGRYEEASRVIAGVIQTFEKGAEYPMLADAMTVQGVIWARLGLHDSSLNILGQAMNVAQEAGAFTNAGRAALTLIEEHGRERLSDMELYSAYHRADELLKNTQDAKEVDRLRACARVLGQRLVGVRLTDKGFVLPDVVLAYEAKFIREALETAKGSVSHAARRLGIRHQTLLHMLQSRHQDLLGLRTPPVKRKRSIIPRASKKKLPRPVMLHVEDNTQVAGAVKDTFESEGWQVVTCADGATALRMITGKAHHDVMVFDNELPDAMGLELVRRARSLGRRRRTPIIMLAAGDVEAEAWQAGVNAFLRKPEGVDKLPGIVTRLLPAGRGGVAQEAEFSQ